MSQRSRTKWYYTDKERSGATFIRAGFVRNAKIETGYEHDCIRLQIRSAWDGQGDIDMLIRLDEAASISAGLSMVAAKMTDGTCGKRALKRHAKAVEGNSL